MSSHVAGRPPAPRPNAGTRMRPTNEDHTLRLDDGGLEYLDAVDLASALSFPASDPPARSGSA